MNLPPAIAPPLSPQYPPLAPKTSVARWRWWVSLFLMGVAPLLLSLASAQRAPEEAPQLPKTIPALLEFCALQMGTFAVLWGVAWAFSRGGKEELFLSWRGGWKPLAWGALYSVALRLSVLMVAAFVLMWLLMLGFNPEQLAALIKENQPNVGKVFLPYVTQGDPLFRWGFIFLVSFVIAGLREELWRAALLAGLLHLAPKTWKLGARNGVALGVSSALFGMGHLYQGPVGVVLTGILGIGLGAIILWHRSIWPAVIAHGLFNAVSFVALMLFGDKMG